MAGPEQPSRRTRHQQQTPDGDHSCFIATTLGMTTKLAVGAPLGGALHKLCEHSSLWGFGQLHWQQVGLWSSCRTWSASLSRSAATIGQSLLPANFLLVTTLPSPFCWYRHVGRVHCAIARLQSRAVIALKSILGTGDTSSPHSAGLHLMSHC